jgi:hypothetical protein
MDGHLLCSQKLSSVRVCVCVSMCVAVCPVASSQALVRVQKRQILMNECVVLNMVFTLHFHQGYMIQGVTKPPTSHLHEVFQEGPQLREKSMCTLKEPGFIPQTLLVYVND